MVSRFCKMVKFFHGDMEALNARLEFSVYAHQQDLALIKINCLQPKYLN